MEELKVLINKRGILKTALTRFNKHVLQISSSETIATDDLNSLELRLELNKNLLDKYNDVHEKITLQSPDEQHELDLEMFENTFSTSMSKAKYIINNNKKTVCKKDTKLVEDNLPNIGESSIRLPSISLPKFNGEFENWLEFRDTFESLIHKNSNLSNIQKFFYLNTSLTGDAAEAIKSLKVCAENYKVAWELLHKRFENKKLIVQNNIKALFNLESLQRDSYFPVQRLLGGLTKILQSLKNYDQPTADLFFIYIVISKFTRSMRRDWESIKTAGDYPTITELLDFLEKHCEFLGTLEANSSAHGLYHSDANQHKYQNKNAQRSTYNKNTTAHLSTYKISCNFCKDSHAIYQCDSFLRLNVNQRISEVKRLKLCINCLKKNHVTKDCKLQPCRKCNKKHNFLLHIDYSENMESNTSNVNERSPPNGSSINNQEINPDHTPTPGPSEIFYTNHCANNSQILLSTASIEILDVHGNTHHCRALLDPGSQSNFITKELCNSLGLRKIRFNSIISGISQLTSSINFKTNMVFKSRINNYKSEISCLILDKITDCLPIKSFNISELNIPQNMRLADPKCGTSSKIDILLGASIFWELLCVGQHNLGKNKPVLQNTRLGWILGGNYIQNKNDNGSSLHSSLIHFSTISENPLDKQLEKFWALEEYNNNLNKYSEEELYCEEHFNKFTERTDTGRFIVSIPFKQNLIELGDSRASALKRFYSLEKKLDKNPTLKCEYIKFLTEYEDLGHMTKIFENSVSGPHYYLPHHAVVKETSITTKVRVVFDGSARTSTGVSLNDTQYIGPNIQHDLFSILLRFRKHKYVITADIAKMYRQVLIQNNERNMQLTLWRPEKNLPINCYALNTITYGTASASFLAVRCLKQLAIENQNKYPHTSRIIETDFYVDDLITGSDSFESIINTQSEINSILLSAGFELRKWSSNSNKLLAQINPNDEQEKFHFQSNNDCDNKTLGILWDPSSDNLLYSIRESSKHSKCTKRSILSETAQIFDPLGLLSPVIINAKLIIQRLWQHKLSWDEAIPLDINTKWLKIRDKMHNLQQLKIPRHALCKNYNLVELHGFCDASEKAYGACIYVRTTDKSGFVQVTLLCAKSRVAPLKNVTLPRLELCGALLLAQLANKVNDYVNIKFDNFFYWCDSTITLSWIQAAPNKWKTFVANRVAEIQHFTKPRDWRHVKTAENPADLISRGLYPEQMVSAQLWWNGPSWLLEDNVKWPIKDLKRDATILEVRTIANVTTHSNNFQTFSKYSCLNKLKRITAYCLRFINNLKFRDKKCGPLTVEELEIALHKLIKIVQFDSFSSEINNLLRNNPVDPRSKLLSLNPILDEANMLRVGGRIEQSNFNYAKKHPIILPASHQLTYLIIKNEHLRLLHCGTNLLLASLRERYWPISGKNMIKDVIHKCIRCFRAKPKFNNPLMGNLPKLRLEPASPFYNCGVDYAGPVLIKNKRGRGSNLIKAYICIFVCFATKAIHLDLVTELSTEVFLAALRRFMARRGQPLNIYSDNGTNFVGANSELSELNDFLCSTETQRCLKNSLSQINTSWHFIPPRSPHFGGLWEAGVKSVKFHIKRVACNVNLTFDEYYTLLTQIEAVLNSRPISPLSSDINDLEPLTPAHFLIGRRITSIPEVGLLEISDNRLSKYQHIQRITQHFWKRWCKEYVSELQTRTKWKKNVHTLLKPGVLVLVQEDNLPSYKWQVGRVIELHPGKDGINRVVSIKTKSGNPIRRSVSKVCALPIYE